MTNYPSNPGVEPRAALPFNLDKIAAEGSIVELPTREEMHEANRTLDALDKAYCAAKQEQEQALQPLRDTLDELSRYEIDLKNLPAAPKPVIARYGQVIGSEGNLSAVVGEAKSKKSFLCTAIVGDMLKLGAPALQQNGFTRRSCKVLWVDTEQSVIHVSRIARRITHLTGWNDPDAVHPLLKLYALREEPPKERRAILRRAIEAWHPRLVVIDGIADLQLNTNDLEESEALVTELMALSSIYDCHILTVLHTNPNSDKARGHVGSSLQRKAETVLYVHKVGERSVVEPQFCRNEPFERFAFCVENRIDEGIPVPCELPVEQSGEELPRLVMELYGGAVERSVLTNKLCEQGITENHARVKISRAIKRGQLSYNPESRLLSLTALASNLSAWPTPAAQPPIADAEEDSCPF